MLTFSRLALATLLFTGIVCCSSEGGSAGAGVVDSELTGDPRWRAEGLFDRVLVIGASASAGFGLNQDLGVVTAAALGLESSQVLNLASGGFFSRPLRNGRTVMEKAVSYDPTLVIAFDFPFWFAYGRRRDSQRSEFLSQGLDLLDSLDCPLIVGGIPDMTSAIGLMLTAKLVPAVEVQAQLNQQVHTWAAERPLVRFYDLRISQGKVADGPTQLLGHVWPPDGEPVLQPDRLHPTLVGLVGICLDAFDGAGIGDRLGRTPQEIFVAARGMRRSR